MRSLERSLVVAFRDRLRDGRHVDADQRARGSHHRPEQHCRHERRDALDLRRRDVVRRDLALRRALSTGPLDSARGTPQGATTAGIADVFHHVASDSSASNGGNRTTSASRAVATSVGRPSVDSYTSMVRKAGSMSQT